MADKQAFEEVELFDVQQMSTNTFNPGTKTARRMLNVHAHEQPGKLTIRPGYGLKYPHPSHSTLTDTTFMNFDMFYDRQADPDGTEITCLIQKATVKALADDNGDPIVADTLNGFFFWCRPYWDLNHWNDHWQWINNTIITKITAAPDDTYSTMIKVFGNSDHGLGDNSLVRWTIYNKTQNQFAKVMTCRADGSNLRLNISVFDNSWQLDDVLIISKYWLNLDYHQSLYNLVNREDITFHNVLNDMRIGFGGYEGRPGIAIGYRQKYFLAGDISFPQHDDFGVPDALLDFNTINEIILDTHILNIADDYGLLLVADDGTLAAGTYYFRLTGVIDDYSEQLLAEASANVAGGKSITPYPFMVLGKNNPRITKFKLYMSEVDDKLSTYLIKTWNLSALTVEDIGNTPWRIDNNGRMILKPTIDLYTGIDAVNEDNEADSVGQWEAMNEFGGSPVFETDTPGNGTSYAIKFGWGEPAPWNSRNSRIRNLRPDKQQEKRYHP